MNVLLASRVVLLALRGLGWVGNKFPSPEPHPAQVRFERKRKLLAAIALVYPFLLIGVLLYGFPSLSLGGVALLLLLLFIGPSVAMFKLERRWKVEMKRAMNQK
jgi:hypothetical protein